MPKPDPSSARDTSARELLRHLVATLAYRGAKTIRGAPDGFADFRVGPTSRTPVEILSHLCDLLEWALWHARGESRWNQADAGTWSDETERFQTRLAELDDFLASEHALAAPPERLIQGPLADAMTHVGQLAMLRRVAGSPIRGENYFKAEITAGRLGLEQPPPAWEFD